MGLGMVLITGGGTWVVLDLCGHDGQKSLVHLISQRVLASAPDGSLVADTKPGIVLVFLLLYKQKQQIKSFLHNPIPPAVFHCSVK